MIATEPKQPAPPRYSWALLASTIVLITGANLLWYWLDLHNTHTWLQPLFVLAAVSVFFVLLALFGGPRWSGLSFRGRFVIVSSLVLFALLWWFGRTDFFRGHLKGVFPDSALAPLYPFFYLAASCLTARTLFPLVLAKTVLKERPRDFGYSPKGTFELWWVYLVLTLAVIGVVVFFVSGLESFQAKYPLVRGMSRPGEDFLGLFLAYQAAYGLIFISGESFWRGYILFGLERDLGKTALVFMIIPYTMSHYGKPFPETMGAIVAGLVLGYLALRHRSFWLGVAAHWLVALAMDLSAIWRTGLGSS